MTRRTISILGTGFVAALVIGVLVFTAGEKGAVAQSDEVSARAELGKTLDQLTTGDLAGLRILDTPLDLSEVAFTDENEVPFKIADWKGRVVLLNLWATWCPPCRAEMPSLEALQKQRGGDEFEVVTVSIDLKNAAKPLAFFKEVNISALTFFWDKKAAIFNNLKRVGIAFGMPTTVLIDRTGHAIAVLNGPAHWDSERALTIVDATLRAELGKPAS